MSCAFDVEATVSRGLCSSLNGEPDDLDARTCPEHTWLALCADLHAHPPARFPAECIARLLCTTFRARVGSYSLSVQDRTLDIVLRECGVLRCL